MLEQAGVLCLEKDPQSTPLTPSPLQRKHCQAGGHSGLCGVQTRLFVEG